MKHNHSFTKANASVATCSVPEQDPYQALLEDSTCGQWSAGQQAGGVRGYSSLQDPSSSGVWGDGQKGSEQRRPSVSLCLS